MTKLLKKLPKPLLIYGSAALGLIGLNHAFKAGQIDQKYTDKAMLQKQLQAPKPPKVDVQLA